MDASGREVPPQFEAWLQSSLQSEFDKTLDESLPQEWLDLLAERHQAGSSH